MPVLGRFRVQDCKLSSFTEFYSLFKYIITNKDIAYPKPHQEGYKKLVEYSHLKPDQILYVGDRINADIIPAKKIGLQTALVWSEQEKTEADYTFSHVGDIILLFI